MKKLLSLVLAAVLVLGVVGSVQAEELNGIAKGFGGEVKVVVTVEDGKITAVTATGENETPDENENPDEDEIPGDDETPSEGESSKDDDTTTDEQVKDHNQCKEENGGMKNFWIAIINFFRSLFGLPKKCVCGSEI